MLTGEPPDPIPVDVPYVAPSSRRATHKVILLRLLVFVVAVVLSCFCILLVPYAINFLVHISQGYNVRNPFYIAAFFIVFLTNGSPFSVPSNIVIVAAGFLYGWVAFPIAYVGIVLGSFLVFGFVRWLIGQGRLTIDMLDERLGRYSSAFSAAQESLVDCGYTEVVLLQLSILPFGALNCILAFSDVRRRDHLLATMTTRVKIALFVWIGISAPDLAVSIRKLISFQMALSFEMLPILVTFLSSFIGFAVFGYRVQKRLARQLTQEMSESADPSAVNT